MPPGYEPLLAAVCTAPWDELPRLVFADWLDDHGEHDRAEFIRLHCERWRVREKRRANQPLGARIAGLRAANEARWRSELPALPGVGWGRYWRGFVSEARFADPAVLVEHADAVFSATPVQFVSVSGLTPANECGALALPHLRRLYGLRLDDVSTDLNLWQTITGSAWFGGLRHLIAYPALSASERRAQAGPFVAVHPDAMTRYERLLRMVVESGLRGQLRVVHLPLPVWDESEWDRVTQGRIRLGGLTGFTPL